MTKILLHEALKPADERYQHFWDDILSLLDKCEICKQYTNFTCAQRRVCVREEGFVCLVPAFSKILDTVAVIHGIMYGEALVGNEDPEVIEVT